MKPILYMLLFALCCAVAAQAKVQIASRGKAKAVILTQVGATIVERHAAQELANTLKQITGAAFEVWESATTAPESAIIVGPGPVAERLFPEVRPDTFGWEQLTMRTKGGRLLLAGGRPRGTLYAVYRFLQEQCGVRWWSPWAARIPKNPNLSVGDLAVDETPAFESRDPFWFPAFDGDWAARNGSNSQHARLTAEQGGKIVYKGFVHTFYPLVPPDPYFKEHPEWFSLINGRRTADNAQLCTTNPELRDFMVERVRQWLKESPEARIVSISQNDCFNPCQCPNCKAIDDREGSYSGTMLTLVNYIAQKLGPEFPDVAFDTLAYQYTRKAPKTVRPLPNVIVRLCSIECNFAAPLDDPSNKKFAQDMEDWSKVSQRLYVWDYTTDFGHYVMPHPNWFVLGPNVRFFHRHGVKGLFEQGAYQSFSSEMSEMRAWVLAQLLWNPYQDDRKLIDEFLDGYYGKPAAKYIRQYMTVMTGAAKGFYMSCFTSPNTPYLKFKPLSEAERLWQQAEEAAKNDPDLLWRVRQGHLPVRYAFLVNWTPLRRECLRAGAEWPVPKSRKAVADEWLAVATGPGPQGWSPMACVNEGGLTPQAFIARFAEDPADPVVTPQEPLPKRGANPPAPADIPGVNPRACVDAQDNLARLWNEPDGAEVRADPSASDGLAVWMPGSHHEWAFQIPLEKLPARAQKGKWQVYAVIRVEKAADADPNSAAFTAGVYDAGASASRGEIGVAVANAPEMYKSYLLGTMETNKDQYVWVAPTANPGIKAVWVDRMYLVPAK
jgi:hypothetical protein